MKKVVTEFGLFVVICALVALIVRREFFSGSATVIFGQAAAVILMLSSRAAFRNQQFRIVADPGNGPLISRGPYRFLRHPMYAGALLLLWASILGHLSAVSAAIGVAVTGFIIVRIAMEERILRIKYPEYEEYAARTKRLIPFVF